MSVLQEVVQQLENILKTSNQYGPFVCLDAPPPVSILSFDANSDGIQKKRETSQEVLQCDSDPLISQGLSLDQPNDDDDVVLVQSDGEDLIGSLHSDSGLHLLDERSSCHGIGGTAQIEEERKGARVASEMLERLPKVLNSQGSDSIGIDLLQHETLTLQVQEGGTVTADSPVPSTCSVNPLSTIEQLSLNDPLLEICSESNGGIAKVRIDGDDGKGKVDSGVATVQPPKRKGGRRKRAVDPRSIVPKLKRPVGRPRKPIDPSTVPKIKRPRGRPRKCPAANVTIDAVSVPTEASDHRSTLSKGQESSGKDVFTKDSAHTEEVSLVRQSYEMQHEFQNHVDGSTSATPTDSLSNKDCNAPIPTGYIRTDTPLTMPRKELNLETNVSDVLNNHNGIMLSFHLGGEKEEVKTAPAIFSVLGLQECDRSSIGNVLNQGAPAVQVQGQEVEKVTEDSTIPFTGEVNFHNIIEQLSSTDVPDKLHNYHDMGGICSAAEKDTPGTAFENGEIHSPRTREQPAADTLLQNSSESSLQAEKDKVEERNLEGKEMNGDKAFQPTKRKRGRPERPVDPRSIVPKIKRPVGRPRSIVPKIKRPVGRPRSIGPKIKRPVGRSRKKPATNVEKDGVSAPMDQMGDCCTLPCAIGIQNSNRDSNIQKDVLDDCLINPTCTVSTNGDTEKRQESSYGGPISHSFSKVNNNEILENETYEGKQERREQNDSSLWEKETTAVKSAKRTAVSEQKVPKLRLRRKTAPKMREEVFDPPGCLRTRQSSSPGSRSPVSGRYLKQKIDKVGTLIPSSPPAPGPITTDTSMTLLNTSKTTYEVSNSLERDDTSGNDHSDLPNEIELNGKVPNIVQDQPCPAVTGSEVEMVNHPPNHQSQTQETLPKDELNGKVPNGVQDQLCPAVTGSEVEMVNHPPNHQSQTQETLPKDVLSVKRSRGRPRQCPDHHEKLPNVCPASAIGSAANEDTSTKDESKKTCISKDTCETTKKRGRGRPRKKRPAGEAVHYVEMKNRAPPDNRPSSILDDQVHENTDTRLGLKPNVTNSLDDSKLLKTSFPSALNGLALGRLSGKDMQEGSSHETEVMEMESKSALRIPRKPVTVQRVIPIVCSSETEMNYSKMFKQKRNQVTALTHSRRITSDAESCSEGLPLQQDQHRSMLLQNGCTKKSSVRIKKLPKTLITGSLNLDDPSRLAQLFQHPEKHALNMEKKGKDIGTHSMSWNTHHLSAVKSTTPLSSGGRVITPYAQGHFQSCLPTSPQRTIKLNYGDQNAQSMQASVGNEKCLPPPKKVMKYLPIPNSVKTEKGKTLILDRIKKNAAMLRGNCFQNKEIQKKFKARQASLIAKAKSNYVKRGRGRPPKKLVSFGNSVNQKIDEYQPRGPLLISKHLFRSKQKAVKDFTLSQNQLNSALAPEKCVQKRRGRLPVKHDESSKSIPNVAGPVGTDGRGELRKKLGRLFEKSIASHNNRNKKEIPNAASVTIRRKVGRPRKNPSPSVVHVPLKNCTSVNDVRRKPGRPRKNPRPADAVEPEKKTGDAPGCSEVERPIGRPMGSSTCGENSQPVKRKVGRPRKKPVIEYINASPFESLHSQSPVKAMARKRGRPRKRPCEETRPKYPSVPLPITDNFLIRGLGFQPSTFDGFIETPSCDFSMPIEEAVETLEEMPLPEAALTKSDGESTQADTDIVPGCSVGAVEQSFVIEQSEIDFMNNGQWILQQPTKDTELPERSCCISVTTGPVLPPPPSLNIELDDTSLPDTDEAINIPARDVLDSCVSQPEEEIRVPDIQELLAETAPIVIID
ncbi:uncharacterized protein LOC100888437 [Strongylocentrotus purpuratus]|uniref:Uncharacterized protein n=1 Tax=Strongylocentrotus purpuratus TaxID=7668 RepID=A0A7M7NV47_STRPU|nr:uncharacterized protein LOC100888437 [Strongylocentrotus purpuratus]